MSQSTGEVTRRLIAGVIKPLSNNFVERPWGGTRIREFKRLCPLPDQVQTTGAGLGECFEIAAFDDDAEAREHPSRVVLADGSIASLPILLGAHGPELLGERWTRTHGRRIPLLPKILDVRELLSVQGHPPGHTEVYVIIDAEPGATIRVGFKADMDRAALRRQLAAGRRAQLALIDLLRPEASQARVHAVLAPWFADRQTDARAVLPEIEGFLSRGDAAEVCTRLLTELKRHYWYVLDALNEIPVAPGQVIHNANPARIVKRSGRAPAAEVHALGNPEGREIVALEIRKPGPTLRAWDNVRFPIRHVDIDGALAVLNLAATDPSELIVEPASVPGRAHTKVSVDSEYFRLEHLMPPRGSGVEVRDGVPHCLHNLAAPVVLESLDGAVLGRLERGESAIISVSVAGYRLDSAAGDAHVVKVSLP